jgi:hypothetical protein
MTTIESETGSRLLLVGGLLEVGLRLVARLWVLANRNGVCWDKRFPLLRRWLRDNFVHRRFQDLNGVGERLGRTCLALRIPALHAEGTLAECKTDNRDKLTS